MRESKKREVYEHLSRLSRLAQIDGRVQFEAKEQGIKDAKSLKRFLLTLRRSAGFFDYATQSPFTTIRRGTGDAEDVAILGAALAKAAGLKPKIGFRVGPQGQMYVTLIVDGEDVLLGWRERQR